jgi:hypothetical protein
LAEGAGDDLNVESTRHELGHESFAFPISNQRVAAHQRQVQRSENIDEFENAADERLSLAIGQTAQRSVTSQVIVVVCIAARAMERALLRYFDR